MSFFAVTSNKIGIVKNYVLCKALNIFFLDKYDKCYLFFMISKINYKTICSKEIIYWSINDNLRIRYLLHTPSDQWPNIWTERNLIFDLKIVWSVNNDHLNDGVQLRKWPAFPLRLSTRFVYLLSTRFIYSANNLKECHFSF